ncbi:MAG: methyltransferase, partial [Ilumatobacteraceae bacterium]|nr:methyltransferase [Ilumatobacteraceae bacterium]
TSLPPDVRQAAPVTACLDSLRRAGLHVVGYNHPSEIAALQRTYAIDFVAVAETTEEVFGRPFVPINAMLDWAHRRSVPVLLINADITLALEPWELRRMRWLARDGLCYLSRYNHDGDLQRACREPWGIDGFLLHGVDAALFAPSFMSMGQPFWDYWLPHVFSRHGRPLHTAGFAAAYHRNHPTQWSWENWHRCALEFARVTGEDDVERLGDCHLFSISTRQAFEAGTNVLAQAPTGIQQWVESQFADGRPKLFVELGAHRGTDTEWMARLANVHIHAFEPDPRNEQPPRPNVTMHRAAISDNDGPGSLILSAEGWGREWTYSSSIKQPKHHLERYPVTFGGAVPVEMVTLDAFCAREGIGCIDFIWADIQGAEGEMIRGGLDALSRTRYLYTEYSDDELYDGQVTLAEILRLLPQFRVVELWPDDVLLVNTSLS